ncbi:GNAT family N-acetyltransferase [Streptomyces tauricus]|uniref:GNAT family N-acetyltransferase n=1 Tax=Streptomyces tauricus TaxID=68274 RepID=UPI0037F9A323
MTARDAVTCRRLTADQLLAAAGELGELLADTVDAGASIGFLAPLDRAAAVDWWRRRADALADGSLAVWAAYLDGEIVGTVSLVFPDKPNSRHRAELVKLMVHRAGRGRGLGRALLATAERAAAEAGVTLLSLDTETDSPAESLYRSAGWTRAGVIPDYARTPSGELHPTTIFYKHVLQHVRADCAGTSPARS